MLKLEEVLGLPKPFTKLTYVNFPVQLKFRSFTVPCIVLTVNFCHFNFLIKFPGWIYTMKKYDQFWHSLAEYVH